jgi:hypothetical protein
VEGRALLILTGGAGQQAQREVWLVAQQMLHAGMPVRVANESGKGDGGARPLHVGLTIDETCRGNV